MNRDYSWVTEEPTDVTIILLSEAADVIRVDRMVSEASHHPQTVVICYNSSEGGRLTFDGEEVYVGDDLFTAFLGMFDDVMDRDPSERKIAMSGWKDDQEVLHP